MAQPLDAPFDIGPGVPFSLQATHTDTDIKFDVFFDARLCYFVGGRRRAGSRLTCHPAIRRSASRPDLFLKRPRRALAASFPLI